MLAMTIQNVELTGVLSVTAETITFVGYREKPPETSIGIRVAFDTPKNTYAFVEAMYHADAANNPIVDTGDKWVLLDLTILRKLELHAPTN